MKFYEAVVAIIKSFNARGPAWGLLALAMILGTIIIVVGRFPAAVLAPIASGGVAIAAKIAKSGH